MTRQAAMASFAAALLSACLCTQAQQNSKKRVEAFAKLPDWSGLWEWDAYVGVADGQQLTPEGSRRMAAFIAAMQPSFTPAWQPKYDQLMQSLHAAMAADPNNPPATFEACAARPFPATYLPEYYEWRVTPEETTLISAMGSIRHIYTDGRSHPPADELWPTKMGDSIGHWEGGTLVVDTIATKPELWLLLREAFRVAVPMSSQLHFTERIGMVNPNEMQIHFTADDPIALAKPIQVTITHMRVTDLNRMSEENDCDPATERNPIVNGRFQTVIH